MKICPLFLLIAIVSCQAKRSSNENEIKLNDTITTASGLKYFYIKRGEGRQIEEGTKVTAYNKLYLSGSDTVFWSTDDSEDSAFSFVQGKTSLIDGALELYPLLREGDELVAIMHPDIGYGPNDRRGLPGGSTLTFNPIKIKAVSEPKEMLGDTLYAMSQNGSAEDVLNLYNSINEGEFRSQFHMEFSLLGSFMGNLAKEEKFEMLETLAVTFEESAEKEDDKQMLGYFMMLAAEKQNKIDKAIEYVTGFLADDPDDSYLQDRLKELQELRAAQ